MPVIIKYVVERNGIEKMTFTSKTEADAYDKLLDTADALYELLEKSNLADDHGQKEALSMYLAQQKNTLLDILSNKKKTSQKKPKSATKTCATSPNVINGSSSKKPLEDVIIEPDEDIPFEESHTLLDEENLDYSESDAA